MAVGQLTPESAAAYAESLRPFLEDPATMIVVSSDFCHWGQRFGYTRYQASASAPAVTLQDKTPADTYASLPIYASIAALDAAGMQAVAWGPQRAIQARDAFRAYLQDTRNTICGRFPILLLHACMHALEERGQRFECRFIHYEVRRRLTAAKRAVHDPARQLGVVRGGVRPRRIYVDLLEPRRHARVALGAHLVEALMQHADRIVACVRRSATHLPSSRRL